MDIVHRIVSTEEQLKGMARDVEKVKAAVGTFVQWANRKLQELDEETELELETTRPTKRARKKKTMPGEMAQDDFYWG